MMKFKLPVMAALLLAVTSHSQELESGTFGDGIFNVVAQDSSYSTNFTIRMQSRFISDWDVSSSGETQDVNTNFLVRRARLKFKGFAYSPKLSYKLQLGLSNNDMSGASEFTGGAPRFLYDAVIKWNALPNLEIWAGQTKLPGNREQLISSGSLETVDRSLVNSYFNLGRDLGIQLHHAFRLGDRFTVREAISIAKGEGRNITSPNLGGFQYTLRGEVFPFGEFDAYSGADFDYETSPKVALGVSYDLNDNAVRTESNSGTFMYIDEGFFETDIQTLFIDAMLKYEGISVMAEYGRRTADQTMAVNSDGSLAGATVNTGEGFNIQAGYLFPNHIQLVGRYTQVDTDYEVFPVNEEEFTLALSKYIVGHNLKIQTDLTYGQENDMEDHLLYRLQFEVQF